MKWNIVLNNLRKNADVAIMSCANEKKRIVYKQNAVQVRRLVGQ